MIDYVKHYKSQIINKINSNLNKIDILKLKTTEEEQEVKTFN